MSSKDILQNILNNQPGEEFDLHNRKNNKRLGTIQDRADG